MKRAGILGLGNIGRAVAANLAEAGFEVTAIRRPSAADFPRLVDSPAAPNAVASASPRPWSARPWNGTRG